MLTRWLLHHQCPEDCPCWFLCQKSLKGGTTGSMQGCSSTAKRYSCSTCFRDCWVQQLHRPNWSALQHNFTRWYLTTVLRSGTHHDGTARPATSSVHGSRKPSRKRIRPLEACIHNSSYTFRSQHRSDRKKTRIAVSTFAAGFVERTIASQLCSESHPRHIFQPPWNPCVY